MKTITITHSKGGTSKSMNSYQLTGLFHQKKIKYLTIDCDTDNRTISTINDYIRQGQKLNIKMATSAIMLQQFIEEAKEQNIDIVLIDTGGNSNEITREALRLSDKIITPISHDSVTEVVGYTRFKSVLSMVGNPKIYITFANVNTKTTKFMNVTNVLKTYPNLEIMEHGLKSRNIYKQSIAKGLSVAELKPTNNKLFNQQLKTAKRELKEFYQEIQKE
jgi:cellulose biosynthesis protein BcsQ